MIDADRLNHEELVQVRFGRNRFLAALGGFMTAFAVRAFVPETAQAAHGSTPYPCFGYGGCHCCSGSVCCESRCTPLAPGHSHCPSGTDCWFTCVGPFSPAGIGNLYKCCDYHCGTCANGHCICSAHVGTCTST